MKKPLLSELTLREKIGQCLCVPQFDLHVKTEVGRDVLRTKEERIALVEQEQFGCVWCHGGQDFKQIDLTADFSISTGPKIPAKEYREWIKETQSKLKIPALNSIDAETGASGTFSDMSTSCAPLSVGATDSEEYAFELGAALGKELLCAGINWRWAPPADICNRFEFCGGAMRSFSQVPDKLIRLAKAHIKGMQSVGVAATLKHFPGSDGKEFRDDHFTPTMNRATKEEWLKDIGRVYKEIIEDGVYAVMTSHMAFPGCDSTKINGLYIPATLSYKITTELLKGEFGFKGVVITDGITMGGLSAFYDHDDLIVEIMKAGNDVILSCGIHDVEILEKAVLDGRLPESRIDDACQRVLDMKEKIGLFKDDYSLDTCETKDVTPNTQKLIAEISDKSMTIVRNENNMLPFDKKKIKNVAIIISTHTEGFTKEVNEFLVLEFEKRGINVTTQRRLDSLDQLKKIDEENDIIIYAAYLGVHAPKGGLFFFGEECQTFHHAFTYGKEKSVGVSFGYPYIHYDIMGAANAFINAYSSSKFAMESFVKALLGEIPFEGVSPVDLGPTYLEW